MTLRNSFIGSIKSEDKEEQGYFGESGYMNDPFAGMDEHVWEPIVREYMLLVPVVNIR